MRKAKKCHDPAAAAGKGIKLEEGRETCIDMKSGKDGDSCVRMCPDGAKWNRKMKKCMCDDRTMAVRFKSGEDEENPAWRNKGTCRKGNFC